MGSGTQLREDVRRHSCDKAAFHDCTISLNELYSVKDYADRDAHFSRIAGAIERLLPQQAACDVPLVASETEIARTRRQAG